MKSNYVKRMGTLTVAVLLGALLSVQPGAHAADVVRYDAQPVGSKCKMEGTSTVHDWAMETVIIGGFVEADPKFPESALSDAAAAKPNVSAFMPVRSFKSGKSVMDQKMQDSMNATKFPKIEYRLIELKPKSKPGATGPLQFDAVGALTITGNTVTNTMPVTIEKKDGKLKIIGNTPIKMTDYKMKPPVITLLGIPTMSVGDDLKIAFEWSLAPKAP